MFSKFFMRQMDAPTNYEESKYSKKKQKNTKNERKMIQKEITITKYYVQVNYKLTSIFLAQKKLETKQMFMLYS